MFSKNKNMFPMTILQRKLNVAHARFIFSTDKSTLPITTLEGEINLSIRKKGKTHINIGR